MLTEDLSGAFWQSVEIQREKGALVVCQSQCAIVRYRFQAIEQEGTLVGRQSLGSAVGQFKQATGG